MNTWGKYLIALMIATSLIACGENNPAISSENLEQVSTTKAQPAAVKKNAPAKTTTLHIGGLPTPFKSVSENVAAFDPRTPDHNKTTEPKVAAFTIDRENLNKLTNLTLDLAKDDLYEDKIEIESESEGSPNCVIVAGWMVPGQDQEQYVTFKLIFENNELTFNNFERENLEKIKNIEFNKTLGTTLMCSNLNVKDADSDNTTSANKIPVNLRVIDSDAVVSTPAKLSKREEKKLAKKSRETAKKEVKDESEEEAVTTEQPKQKEPVQKPVQQDYSNRKTTVDGVPLQVNKIEQLDAPIASRNDLFNSFSN